MNKSQDPEAAETVQTTDSPAVVHERLVVLLRECGPMTLTEIGESMWGGKRKRQSYARPAGALIARMVKAGTVRQALSPDLGYKRNPLDPAQWMLTSQHNERAHPWAQLNSQ